MILIRVLKARYAPFPWILQLCINPMSSGLPFHACIYASLLTLLAFQTTTTLVGAQNNVVGDKAAATRYVFVLYV